MPIPFQFDFKNPDYNPVFNRRKNILLKIRADKSLLAPLKKYYKENPAQFIIDWGMTYDPKNVEKNLPSFVPFLLFEKQEEWVNEVVKHWYGAQPLLTEKTRQMGFSWLSVALACTLCIFNQGIAIGFGSRKEEYVDRIGDPKSLFAKARLFMKGLPKEFRAGWKEGVNASHMRITFPDTGASLTGEAGDNIGRGNTTSLYFVDEAAFLERPQLIEASLSQTTNCRIDISTPNGLGNPFAQKRFSGKYDVFSFHWRSDPRKDDAWYKKQVETLDPRVLAQEVDINYSASVEGVLIPSPWIMAAIDADRRLNISIDGTKRGALDVADEGADKNAYCARHGVSIVAVEQWSGVGADIFGTVQKAVAMHDAYGCALMLYDADGLGAGVRGDLRIINEQRQQTRLPQIQIEAFRGSGEVFKPDSEIVEGRKNKDFFANYKAQSWWALRTRFQNTYRAVVENMPYDKDEIINIPANMPNRAELCIELSQPTYDINGAGKIIVNKAPDGAKSPNLADSVMMCFAPAHKPMNITKDALMGFAMTRTR